MLRTWGGLSALIAVSLLAGTLAAQLPARTTEDKQAYRKTMEDADQKIAAEVKNHSELMKNLEYLTTMIGPRLTGSPQMQAASDWTLKRFQDYGVQAHLETSEIAHGWIRGPEFAEITNPIRRRIGIHALGWSKATPGEVSGAVIAPTIEKVADLEQYKGKLKGAVILLSRPADLSTEQVNPENAYDAVIAPSHGLPTGNEMGWRDRLELLEQIAQQQPALLLMDSGKIDNLYNMAGGFGGFKPTEVPMAFLAHENYELIFRLLQAGPVTLRANLQNSFTAKPVPVSITVAEIKGSELPDERVIVGGHLDSWDLGQGALDNGTGALATIEAARALQALGWKPKRTITFVLFTGEEQGGIGADTFLQRHGSEIPKMDAVLIHDTGTGKVFSVALEGLWETTPLMEEIYQPLQEVFDLQPLSTRYFGASDHVPFLNKGVPAYFCLQLPDHYREAHHSQTDTFDKVVAEQINEGAAFLAAWAWNVSQMPQALPHHSERALE